MINQTAPAAIALPVQFNINRKRTQAMPASFISKIKYQSSYSYFFA